MFKSLATTFFAGLIVTSLAAPTASAQRSVRKAKEVKRDTRQIKDDRQDRAQFARMAKDVVALQGKPKLMATFDARVIAAMGAEKRENKQELRQDKRELKRSRAKARTANLNNKGIARKVGTKVARADDRRDRNAQAVDVNAIAKYRNQYTALRGKASPAAVRKKASILNAVARMQAGEIRDGKAERREDLSGAKVKVRKKRLRR